MDKKYINDMIRKNIILISGNEMDCLTDDDNLISNGFNARDLAYLYFLLQRDLNIKFSIEGIKNYRFDTVGKITEYICSL